MHPYKLTVAKPRAAQGETLPQRSGDVSVGDLSDANPRASYIEERTVVYYKVRQLALPRSTSGRLDELDWGRRQRSPCRRGCRLYLCSRQPKPYADETNRSIAHAALPFLSLCTPHGVAGLACFVAEFQPWW